MKGLFIGLVLGAIAMWCWYQTGGKIHITETKTITVIETNWVTKTKTRYIDETRWITKTNEVWKTNIVEKIAQTAPIAIVAPVVQKTIEQPKVVQQTTTTPIKKVTTELRGARPAGKVTMGAPAKRDMKVKTRRGMDGNIK